MIVRAVILDIGGIVIQYSFAPAVRIWSEVTGINVSGLIDRFRGDTELERFERNEISGEEFYSHVCEMTGLTLSYEDFLRGWNGIFLGLTPGIEALLVTLKEHTRIIGLSNSNSIHTPLWKEKYRRALSHFERIFTSDEIGVRKPEPLAYGAVLDYLGEEPERVAFVDDDPVNVEGACALRMHALVGKSSEQIGRYLRTFGLLA